MLKSLMLKNGLTVLRLPKASSNICTVGFIIQTGSSVELNAFPSGISHLVERLFWTGTDKHPSKRQLNRALESMGGNYYSQTTPEYTEFYITVPQEHQFKAVSMLSEIIQHSHFDPRDIEAEKQFVVNKSSNYDLDTGYEFSNLAVANIYDGYGLSMPLYGDLESVMSIKEADVHEYVTRQYIPEKSYIVVSGNFANKEIVDLISQEWSFWNPKNKDFIELKRFPVEDVAANLPSIMYKQMGLPETLIVCGFLLDEGAEPRIIRETSDEAKENMDIGRIQERMLDEWAHLLLLNTILGQGLSSKLWLKGVEEEMLFDRIYSNLIRFSRSAYLQITGIADNSQFTFALESVLSTLDSMKKTPVSINEIVRAKETLKGRLIMEQEDLLSSTIWQVENLISSSLTFEVSELIDRIQTIEAPAIRALASDLFVPKRFFLSTLGTAKESLLVDKLIKKYLN